MKRIQPQHLWLALGLGVNIHAARAGKRRKP